MNAAYIIFIVITMLVNTSSAVNLKCHNNGTAIAECEIKHDNTIVAWIAVSIMFGGIL